MDQPDHVAAIDPHLPNSSFTAGALDQPATFYPCLLLKMSTGENLLVPLGGGNSERAALLLIAAAISALANSHAGESMWERFELQFRN